ncbi:hypothetical protein PIB30_053778 [Stylosanthes scabra]|uniref:Uncharacterized protein n=1 Tax=Stylosanthes scabra TaxID=79078 RepID=A0ABU6VH65_9FABA|nr:hypothetical protein [Stylosanthes scabra]
MTRVDRGRGRGDREKGSSGYRGRPKKRTGVPLDLRQDDPPPTQGTTTLPPPVIPMPSLSEGLPAMRMIPTLGSRVQSSDTPGTRGHTQTTSAPTSSQPAHGHDDDSDVQPPPEPDPMPYPQLIILCRRVRRRTLRQRRQPQPRLVACTSVGTAVTGGMSLSSVRLRSMWSSFGRTVGGAFSDSKGVKSSRFMSLGSREPPRGSGSYFTRYGRRGRRMDGFLRTSLDDFKRLQRTNTKNRASETGGSMHTGGPTTYPATRERMSLEMGRTPSFSEVFARTHTRKKDREWVDKRSHDFKEAFEVEKNRLEAEGDLARIAGGRKKGRIYGKGVVPAYSVPLIIGDVDVDIDVDVDDTASGPLDVREQVRTLETALETQSQEVSQLRKGYFHMYIFLELMRSGGSGSAAFTAMPPLPPPPPPPRPPARSPSPLLQQDRAASPSQHDDDPDYV